MDIIDAQVHVWNSVRSGTTKPVAPSFTVDALLGLMNDVGVGRAVLVPASYDPTGNQTCLDAATTYPDRFAVMGLLPADQADLTVDLADWLSIPGMIGIRGSYRRRAEEFEAGRSDWIWPAAEDAGIPVMIYSPGRLAKVRDIARKHPALRIVIDHIGVQPNARGDELASQVDALLELSSLPNVAVKISALPRNSDQPYPFRDLHALVCGIIREFGPERSFWGSDISRIDCSYKQVVTMMTEELSCLTDSELNLVMGAALPSWLNWP